MDLTNEQIQAMLASLIQRTQSIPLGASVSQVKSLIASAISNSTSSASGTWQLHDLDPSVIDTDTTSGTSGYETATLSNVPTSATHACVHFSAKGGSANDQVTIVYRKDSSDSDRPVIDMQAVQGSADTDEADCTAPVPLQSASFQYKVSGTFSSDTEWTLTLLGYYGVE